MTDLARLRRLSETLPALGDDGAWLAEGIAAYLDGQADIEAALGIKVQPGQLRPSTRVAIDRRNGHLRQAAATFNLSAIELATELARYEASSWRRERVLDDCPARLHGRLQEQFWRALKAYPRVIGERQIENLLRNEGGIFISESMPENTNHQNTRGTTK